MMVLRQGKRGKTVRKWQFFLIGQGLQPGKADGIFGAKTDQATKEFQEKYGLVADGVVGNQTYGQAMLLGFGLLKDREDQSDRGPNWPPEPDFPPLVSNSARQEVFGKFAYVSAPLPDNVEHIRITDGWDDDNIVTVEIPQLAGIQGAGRSGRASFHRLGVEQLKGLWQAWEEAGLLDRVLTWEGAYDPRFVRGSRTNLSNHAFGSAFDINYTWNKLGQQPAFVGDKGSVRELVPLAHKFGFYWGGHFDNRPDGMHFEVARIG